MDMIKPSTEYFLAFARDLVVRSSWEALRNFRHVTGWLKNNRSVVTDMDIQIQKTLARTIASRFPTHGFIGEEKLDDAPPAKPDAEYIWVADPIDGTDAYATGLPGWGISLALLHHGEPLVGVFYQPVTQELFHAAADGDAILTYKPGRADEEHINLHVATTSDFNNRSLFLVPSHFHRNYISDFPGKQRTLGSLAAHQSLIARGAGVASFMKPHIWDIAASYLILQRAGGLTLDLLTGQPIVFGDYVETLKMPWLLAASNYQVANQIAAMITPRHADVPKPWG